MNAIVRFSIARPKTVIAIWVVLAAICVPLMIALTGALKAGGFDNPRGEAAAGQKVIERTFDEAPESLQVVLTKPDGDVTAELAEATRVAEETPHVASVQDYRQDPEWLSPDKHTTFLQLGFRVDKSTIQHEIDGLRERMTGAMRDRGVQVHVTGAQALDYDLSVQSEKDAITAEMIAFPLLIVVLLVVFRSVGAMLLPIVLAGLALVVASAIGYLITFATDLSTLYTNAVSLIGIAVAVDYSLFIIKRYRDELVAGDTYVPALRTAMRTAGHAVLFSGLAVVVALLALFIPRIMVFSSMAIAGVVVTLVALAMSMSLLPAALTVMGRRINWLSLKPRAARTGRGGAGLLTRLQRRPALTLAVLVAIFGVMAWPMTDIRLQSPVASATILPEDADSRQGIERLQAALEFRNLFPVQVVVSAPEGTSPATLLDAVRTVAGTVREQQRIDTVTDVTSIGLPAEAVTAAVSGQSAALPPEAKAGFDQLWGVDGDRLVSRVVVIPGSDPDSDAAHDLIHDLRDELPGAVPDGVRVQVAGATATGVDFDEILIDTLPAILIAVALITIALLARAFRSWLLPLLALALNALVVAASLGLLTAISQNWLGQRIDSTTPALVFAIMFGLSMDYMVIMISRMREHFVQHGDHHAAVTNGLRDTAGLVNGAALIMVAVFASFLVAKVSVVQQLGLGLGIAVALDAVVIRLLVMPAALNLIGPRVWGRVAKRATDGQRTTDPEPVPAA
ncbi:MMPL family transporter [Micromonospora sp. NPDC050187]|uniref:MMPL family transporter n=1 Tax=Micromonospora sp. NPDC050187 TaxID=3364277 RepID=UPI0037AD4429